MRRLLAFSACALLAPAAFAAKPTQDALSPLYGTWRGPASAGERSSQITFTIAKRGDKTLLTYSSREKGRKTADTGSFELRPAAESGVYKADIPVPEKERKTNIGRFLPPSIPAEMRITKTGEIKLTASFSEKMTAVQFKAEGKLNAAQTALDIAGPTPLGDGKAHFEKRNKRK